MKEFLHEHDIEFETIDVNNIADAAATLREVTGGRVATPVVVIDGDARIGFGPMWMAEKLGLD